MKNPLKLLLPAVLLALPAFAGCSSQMNMESAREQVQRENAENPTEYEEKEEDEMEKQ